MTADGESRAAGTAADRGDAKPAWDIQAEISRRSMLAGIAAGTVLCGARPAAAQDAAAPSPAPAEQPADAWARTVSGTGGEILVQQLRASGHRFVFANPSSGHAPIYDALVDAPDLHLIQAPHEGALAAIADGYCRVSGLVPFVLIARPGLPNAMTQMFNAWKDRIGMVVMADLNSVAEAGQDGFEEIEGIETMARPLCKWQYIIENTAKIPEILRRSIKFSSTRPGGPTFLGIPRDILAGQGEAVVVAQAMHQVNDVVPPDPALLAEAARKLAGARSPLLIIGDEVTMCGGQAEALALAELLAAPVIVGSSGRPISWSSPFPTDHPLYVGTYLPRPGFTDQIDVVLNLGSRMPQPGEAPLVDLRRFLIEVRLDRTDLARNYPTQLAITANSKLAAAELAKRIAAESPAEAAETRAQRRGRIAAHTSERRATLDTIGRGRWSNAPISNERVAMELEAALPRETNVVVEGDSHLPALAMFMTFGGEGKRYVGNTAAALGWGLPATFGVKLAQPERTAVAILSDGSFLFSGPQVFWTYQRYKAGILVLVLNNRSYNNERNRMWMRRGRQYETGRDMACYLGDPDVDYLAMAGAFGVAGERVDKPERLAGAIRRGLSATAAGRSYFLEVMTERRGSGASSQWFPRYEVGSGPGGGKP